MTAFLLWNFSIAYKYSSKNWKIHRKKKKKEAKKRKISQWSGQVAWKKKSF